MKRKEISWFMVFAVLLVAVLATAAMGAYSSHQNDKDVTKFLTAYPFAKSTKLDDCALCHASGADGKNTPGSCAYCHQVYGTKPPYGDITKTLNLFGQAYLAAQGDLKSIETQDSDGDGYSNIQEIQALTFPGSKGDYPGLVSAPAMGLNMERMQRLPDYSQFLLLNASKSQDFYARYRGVKVMDLLKHAGVSKNATQITVFAPDGYSMIFPIEAQDPQTDPSKIQYDVNGPYPYGTFYGGLSFVGYPPAPRCLANGDTIPDRLYMLLAYLRDGDLLTPGRLNGTKLDGEGPYRLIPPQKIAGGPDRGLNDPKQNDGLDYDATKDHNAGSSARTVTAIRVDPLPAGTTDFNWYEGGWNLADKGKLVIYGAIDPRTFPVGGKVTDKNGQPIPDVKISFSLLSLGQVGEASTSPSEDKGRYRKRVGTGKYSINLPPGEYTVVPVKDGYTFTPASFAISLPDPECDLDRDRWQHWDDWERQGHCNRHPDNELNFVGNSTK